MKIVTRTVYGAAMQSAQYLGKPYIVQENSTLNEKFNIQAGRLPDEEDRHRVGWYCIGNKGHRIVAGSDGVPYTDPVQHSATDASLYGHLPFVLRETTDDLSVEQRKSYGLRREETYNGRAYFAYYAKKLDLDVVNINLQKIVIENGAQIKQAFIPTTSNLNPTPLSESEEQDAVIEASDYIVSSSAVLTLAFRESDVEELKSAARIIYGNERYAVVSELGLIGAVEKIVTGKGPSNTTINYTEIIASQIVVHISSYYQLNMQNSGFTFVADVGAAEPLFVASE